MKKSTLRFEEKLKAKIKETLQHIHEITEEETIELEEVAKEETTPEQLEQVADQLEKKWIPLQKKLKKQKKFLFAKNMRSVVNIKKPLKIIRDDFVPRIENTVCIKKYSENAIAFRKRTLMPPLCE